METGLSRRALQGLTYAELVGGVARWSDLGLFGSREGSTYPLSVVLRSPTLPHLSGALAAANVTVARCTDVEVFFEGECVCREGAYKGPGDAVCLPCAPGSYSSARAATACSPCPPSAVARNPGAVQCEACPDFSKASNSRDACFCRAGYFAANIKGLAPGSSSANRGRSVEASLLAPYPPSELRCAPCPTGAVCPGETNLLFTGEGYWRGYQTSTQLFKCAPGVRHPLQHTA